MNYSLFSSLSYDQIQAAKELINQAIDQNFRHQMLDSVSQHEYDNLKKTLRQLDNASYYKIPQNHTA